MPVGKPSVHAATSTPVSRPTVGVLLAEMGGWYGLPLLSGIEEAADRQDANIIYLVGASLEAAETGRTAIFRLARPERLNGLILHADLARHRSDEEIHQFCQQFAPLPLIGYALTTPEMPSVLADSYNGMHQLVTHLVKDHGYRKLAFIHGPAGQMEADERFHAFQDVLLMHGLTINPEWVARGDFSQESGRAAMEALLAHGRPQFEAVVAANDNMAVGALQVLHERGLRVPDDLALTGFDDTTESKLLSVPLTTVRQTFFASGQQSLISALRRIYGETLPNQILVPTSLVVRRSCGCVGEGMRQAAAQAVPGTTGSVQILKALTPQAVDHLVAAAGERTDDDTVWGADARRFDMRTPMTETWNALLSDLESEKNHRFLAAFATALQQLQIVRHDPMIWHEVVSALRNFIRPYLNDAQLVLRVENLLQQARLLVNETSLRSQSQRRGRIDRLDQLLQKLTYSLATALNLDAVAETMAEHLPQMGIEALYLALYDVEGADPTPTTAHLTLQFDHGKGAHLTEGESFPIIQILPPAIFPPQERSTFVVMPLTVGERQLGYMTVRVGPIDWEIYPRLRDLFSSTIFRIVLEEQQREAQNQMERLWADARLHAAELAQAKEQLEQAVTESNRRLKETEGLFEAIRSIVGANEIVDICQKLTRHFSRLVAADQTFIALVNHDERRVTLEVSDGEIVENNDYETLVNGISGVVYRSGQPVLSLHAYDGIEPEASRQRRVQGGTGAVIVAPIMVNQQVSGTVTAVRKLGQDPFAQHDVDLLTALAAQAGESIENALLFEAEREQRELAESLRQAGILVSSTLEFDQVLDQLLEQIQRVVDYDAGSLMLVDGDTVRVARGRGYVFQSEAEKNRPTPEFSLESTITFKEMRNTGQPLVIPDTSSDPHWIKTARSINYRSWMGAPIVSKKGIIGFFSLNKQQPNFFTPKMAQRLAAFANQAALALENASLYENMARFNLQLEERVRARTEELQNAYNVLEQMDRTKSDFISIASHELRTPITVLRGYSQILTTHPAIKSDESVQQMMDGILSGAQRMYEIVNSMIDLAKMDSRLMQLSLEQLPLGYIVRSEMQRFSSAVIERKLTVTLNNLSDLPIIEADNESLRKVFTHLISNAIKYTPDGGTITITGKVLEPGEYGLEEGVLISVADNGIGIAPQMRELIFASFFQTGEVSLHSSSKTKYKGGGPGLGLTIARGIVHAHHGQIWVESGGHDEDVCPGSIFYVALPVHQPKGQKEEA